MSWHCFDRRLVLAVLLTLANPALAVEVLLNNGSQPPDPENVIDSSNSFPEDRVLIANRDCDPRIEPVCSAPGPATIVALENGGRVGGGIVVHQTSELRIQGGQAPSPIDPTVTVAALDDATILMTAGEVGGLVAADASLVTVLGGTVGFVDVISRLVYEGGQIGGITAFSGGIALIFGSEFAVGGVPVGLGPIAASDGVLTGRLRSGEAIALQFDRGVFSGIDGHIILVPEAGTGSFAMTGLALLGAVGRIRSRCPSQRWPARDL